MGKFSTVLLIPFLLAIPTYTAAQTAETVIAPSEMTKGENLRTPTVPIKLHEAMSDYMLHEAQALLKMGYTVETERNGEVIVITIPAAELFAPNSTELLPFGKRKLEPLVAYLRVEDRFKMILAMHSDDTGSVGYKETLTDERIGSIIRYMASIAAYPDQIIGYALADDEPLMPNTTRENRNLNRRLEIFIVPSTVLIQKIKKR